MLIQDFFMSKGFGFLLMVVLYIFSIYQAFHAGYAKRGIEERASKKDTSQIVNYVYGNGTIIRFDEKNVYHIDVENNKLTTIPLDEIEKQKVEKE